MDFTLTGVQLRPGVTADLHVKVFVDEASPGASCTASRTAVAVPGFAHTAATWGPFAEALFDEDVQPVCRLVACDLPGHGQSGLPGGGLPFGQRPAIDAGIFNFRLGSLLTVASFENDQLVRPAEAAALFAHLTGNNVGLLAAVSGAEAVHDMYISDPASLLGGVQIVLP